MFRKTKQLSWYLVLLATMGSWLALFGPRPARASALGDLAASMQPGTWAELKSNGFITGGQSILYPASGAFDSLWAYSDEFIWDPVRKKIYHYGAQHGGTQADARFITYDDATNSWSDLTNDKPFSHAYDHQAFNPATGLYYFRRYATNNVYVYDTNGNSWLTNITIPDSTPVVAIGFEFFPERNEIFKVDENNWRVYNVGTGSWTNSGRVSPIGSYHNIARYSAVHKLILFGGGNDYPRKLYTYDQNGTIAAATDAPVDISVAQTSQVAADPATGNFLVLSRSGAFYEYNPITKVWTLISNNPPPFVTSGYYNTQDPNDYQIGVAPVPNYGVTLWLVPNYGNSKIYVYKSPSASSPPAAPSNLGLK